METCKLLSTVPFVVAMVVLPFGSATRTAQGQELGEERWEFTVSPYFWAAGIDGDVKLRGLEAEIDVDFSDVWDALECAGSVHIEARKGKWGFILDPLYMDLSVDKDLTPATAELDLTMWTVEFGGLYRLAEWYGTSDRASRVDVLVGGRYWDVEQDLQIGPLSSTSDEDWIDPFIGARLVVQMKDWLALRVRADIGGFAVSSSASELTWNIFAGPVFTLSDSLDIVAGYRWLDLDREDGADELDVTLSGPMIGALIRF